MARITSFVATAALVLSTTVAVAGGMNEPKNDDDVVVALPTCTGSPSLCAGGLGGSGTAAAALLGALALGAALSSGSH